MGARQQDAMPRPSTCAVVRSEIKRTYPYLDGGEVREGVVQDNLATAHVLVQDSLIVALALYHHVFVLIMRAVRKVHERLPYL